MLPNPHQLLSQTFHFSAVCVKFESYSMFCQRPPESCFALFCLNGYKSTVKETLSTAAFVFMSFLLKKKKEEKRNKTLWSWKNWFLLVLSVLFTFLWQTLGFPLCYSQCKHIQYWIDLFDSFWTCSIRFQMHWFMGICKVPTTLKKKSTLTQELFYIRII